MTSKALPPSPIVTVDAAVFCLLEGSLHLLLVRRSQPPYRGRWALPGGFVHAQEDADSHAAVHRVLQEKASMEVRHLEQLATFASSRRDPRGWSVSIAHVALVDGQGLKAPAGVRLFPVDAIPDLPFDHGAIVQAALARLRDKSSYSSLPALLLPPVFTLPQLQAVYEQVLGMPLNAAAFRRKVMAQALVEPARPPRPPAGAVGRPAAHYRLAQPGLQDMGRVVMIPARRRSH